MLYMVLGQLIAIIVTFLIIKKFGYKSFKAVMDARKSFIEDSISSAAESKLEATELKLVAATERDEVRQNKKLIIDEAHKNAKKEAEGIVQKSKDNAKNIITKAHSDIEQEKITVQAELSGDVMDLVSLVSAKFIAGNISKEVEESMINDAIALVSNGQ